MGRYHWFEGLAGSCLLLSVVVGCSDSNDDDPKYTIASETMSGTIGGKPWSFGSGMASPSLLDDDSRLFGELYADTTIGCDTPPPFRSNRLLLDVPKAPGDYRLSVSLNATFVVPDSSGTPNNLVAMQGRMQVDEVTSTSIRGGAYVTFDQNNTVNGQFELPICPE